MGSVHEGGGGTSADELLVDEGAGATSPTDWSSDGRFILYVISRPDAARDLWAQPLEGDRKPFPVLATPFNETNAQFSPDGRWIAYQSDESGRFEIYVQPFPGPGRKVQVSGEGGVQVRWRRDGRGLSYLASGNRLMAVPIQLDTYHLPEEGISPDDEISYEQGERTLRQAFDIMLDDVAGAKLTYVVRDGAILRHHGIFWNR